MTAVAFPAEMGTLIRVALKRAPDLLRLAVPLFDKTIRIYDMAPKLDVAAK